MARGQPKNIIRQLHDDLLWAIDEANAWHGSMNLNTEHRRKFDHNIARARRALRTLFPTLRIRKTKG